MSLVHFDGWVCIISYNARSEEEETGEWSGYLYCILLMLYGMEMRRFWRL